MRSLLHRLRVVVAIFVATLAFGRALPGLAGALIGTSSHVCTCATGGAHASCPVCNPSLNEHRRGALPAVDGLPCGDGRVAVGTASDPSLLPAGLVAIASAGERQAAPTAEHVVMGERFTEPPTPPPRVERT